MNASPDGPNLIEEGAFVAPVAADETTVRVEEARRVIADEFFDSLADLRPLRGPISYPHGFDEERP